MFSPAGSILSEVLDLPSLICKVLCLQNTWTSQRLPDVEDISEMSWGTWKTLLFPSGSKTPMALPSHVILQIVRGSGSQHRKAQRKNQYSQILFFIEICVTHSEMYNIEEIWSFLVLNLPLTSTYWSMLYLCLFRIGWVITKLSFPVKRRYFF